MHNIPVVNEKQRKKNKNWTEDHEARFKNAIRERRKEASKADMTRIKYGRVVHRHNRLGTETLKICRQFQICKIIYIHNNIRF